MSSNDAIQVLLDVATGKQAILSQDQADELAAGLDSAPAAPAPAEPAPAPAPAEEVPSGEAV